MGARETDWVRWGGGQGRVRKDLTQEREKGRHWGLRCCND